MNLHAIANRFTQIVNPDIAATLLRSTGYTTGADGTRTPTYTTLSGMIQVQGISGSDYEHINAMNQMASYRTVYLCGNWAGIIRTDETGGDVMQFPRVAGGELNTWKLITVKEAWPAWTCVIVCLQ